MFNAQMAYRVQSKTSYGPSDCECMTEPLCHTLTVRVYLTLCIGKHIYSLLVVCCVQLEVLTEHWDEFVARCNVDGGQEGSYDGKTREQGLLQR